MEEQTTMVANASTEYVGRWNCLISTTNWEKGRIIFEWRQAMAEADAPASSWTDESWSRQVGGVSPQHVGRLRRVFERFGPTRDDYRGLYWSHFQVALDWPDAEMYLQGAVENGWSVAQMRDQRWEAMGGAPESRPSEADVVSGELDEDRGEAGDLPSAIISDSLGEVHGDGDPFDDEPAGEAGDRKPRASRDAAETPAAAAATAEPLRPFESLPTLPADLRDAFDLFRLAILNHKVSGWREIARDDVLAVLDSLKQLAPAPAE